MEQAKQVTGSLEEEACRSVELRVELSCGKSRVETGHLGLGPLWGDTPGTAPSVLLQCLAKMVHHILHSLQQVLPCHFLDTFCSHSISHNTRRNIWEKKR